MSESLHALMVLCLIVPLIIAVVYGLKYVTARPFNLKANQPIIIKHQMNIGAKERLMCIEVNGMTLLLGVTPHAISTLHVFSHQDTNLGKKDLS